MNPRRLRVGAGAAVLLSLAGFGALVSPVYYRDLQFRRALAEIVRENRPDEQVRRQVAERAAGLGLPVRAEQVRLQRTAEHLRIDVPYAVPLKLSVYSVRLHFHPSAER